MITIKSLTAFMIIIGSPVHYCPSGFKAPFRGLCMSVAIQIFYYRTFLNAVKMFFRYGVGVCHAAPDSIVKRVELSSKEMVSLELTDVRVASGSIALSYISYISP